MYIPTQRDKKMATINGVYLFNISKYNTRSVAMEFKSRTTLQGYRYGIFHGDDGLFWVVSGARNINRLREAMYEQIG